MMDNPATETFPPEKESNFHEILVDDHWCVKHQFREETRTMLQDYILVPLKGCISLTRAVIYSIDVWPSVPVQTTTLLYPKLKHKNK